MPIKREPRIIDGNEVWFCPHCGRWKLKAEYHRYTRSPAGIYYYCRKCQNQIMRIKYKPKSRYANDAPKRVKV